MTLKDKFEAYKQSNANVEACKFRLAEAEKERSEAVKAIAEEISPKKKIMSEGKELTIVVRGDTYFFRGEGGKRNDVVEI